MARRRAGQISLRPTVVITVTVSCDSEGCDRTNTMSVSSDQLYSNITVKQTVPRGWRTFTPRQQDRAVAYCPEHA